MGILAKICDKLKRSIRGIILYPRIKTLNSSLPLDIKTYDGGNEGLHPSCLYFKNGWNGYRFWFTFTPYKDMNDAIENPCVFHSENGIDFEPVSTANPLDNITLNKEQEYNSDPELVYNSDYNRIECWWRRVQRADYPLEDGKNTEIIYRSYSYNGLDWSEKEVILRYKNPFNETRGVISPAIIYENRTYKMWVSSSNDVEGISRYIAYYEMTDNTPMILRSKFSLGEHKISHLDVIQKDEVYYLIGFDVSLNGNPYYLFSSSKPEGPFDCKGVVLTPGKKGRWDNRLLYRPSITEVDDELWLYYSAYRDKPSNSNHVGLIKFRSFDDLRKCYLW